MSGPDGAPLTEAEMAAWRPNLISWKILDRLLDRQLERDAGMPHAYYAILTALVDRRGEAVPLTRLAAVLDYSQSRLSHAIGRMVDSGWVERVGDPADRRVSALRLTAGGSRQWAMASRGHLEEIRRSFLAFLDHRDLVDLARIGDKLLDGLTDCPPEEARFGRAARRPTDV